MYLYPREKYTSGLEMQIHKVKSNTTLEVSVDPAQRHLVTDVVDTEVGEMRFRDGLVHRLVLLYTAEEITFGIFARHILVIGIA